MLNKIYKLVWSRSQNAWVVVSEIAKRCGKSSSVVDATSKADSKEASAFAKELDPPKLNLKSRIIPNLLLLLGMSAGVAYGADPVPTQLPTGATVSAGQAAVTQSGAAMTVQQSTDKAIINWNTFDVGSKASVNFNQPSTSSATLNRVNDTQASKILGTITSNGQVFLINSNGIYFGKTATVDVGSLYAGTGNISDSNFMSGNMTFTNNGTGVVVNEGKIRAALEGYIALFAPEVINQGLIVARLGTVALASGQSITLNFSGSKSLSGIIVDPAKISALIKNKGAVLAPGGTIILSAQSLDQLQGGVVNNSGRLEAKGLANRGGKIVLTASNTIENTGVISANASKSGPAGTIELTAPNVTNTGTIAAVGGTTQINTTANVAAEAHNHNAPANVTPPAQSNTVNISSPVTVSVNAGSVKINAEKSVNMTGQINVTSNEGVGGSVVINSAGNISLDSAVINASGGQAGGSILISGGASNQSAPTPPSFPGTPTAPNSVLLFGNTVLSSSSRRGKGGSVDVLGNQVGLLDNTNINVSGQLGGGTAIIGGGLHGQDPNVTNSNAVYVGQNVNINADALGSGNGGNVVVWSDSLTTYLGNISAQGGALGGDGGFVEVSSHGQLNYLGQVNTTAALGHVGTLLLDPADLIISSTSDANISGSTPFTPSGSSSYLSVSTLQNALSSSAVVVQTGLDSQSGSGNITVSSDISWVNPFKLSLQAYNNLNLNANITSVVGNLSLYAGYGNANAVSANQSINIGNNVTIFLVSGSLLANATGNITQTAATGNGMIGAFQISGTSSFVSGANITLASTLNTFTGAINANTTGGLILVNNLTTKLGNITAGSQGVNIATASGSAGSINLKSGSTITSSGPLVFNADGAGCVTVAGIVGNATINSVTAGGAITLGNASTGVLTLGNGSTTSSVVGVAGSAGQASGQVNITGSSIVLNSPIVTAGGGVFLNATNGTVTTSTNGTITTTAQVNSGSSSGNIVVNATSDITLKTLTSMGADNNAGPASNASPIIITSSGGNVTIGAATASGGNTQNLSYSSNGGNAANIVIQAGTSGTITLNGDLSSIGGGNLSISGVGQGLGGLIWLKSATILNRNTLVTTGATTGDITFSSSINSDATPRILNITAGIGNVTLGGDIGTSSALSAINVASSTIINVSGNVTTSGASGVYLVAGAGATVGQINIGNALSNITIDTSLGNGTVTFAPNAYLTTYGVDTLQGNTTFVRGSGAISFGGYLYSAANGAYNLTFNGSSANGTVGGGDISVLRDIGGAAAGNTSALGNITINSVRNLAFSQSVIAKSLVSTSGTGTASIGSTYLSCGSSAGFNVFTNSTSSSAISSYGVILTNTTAPIIMNAPVGGISFSAANVTTAGGNITIYAGNTSYGLNLPTQEGINYGLYSNNGAISITGYNVYNAWSSQVDAGSGKIVINALGGTYSSYPYAYLNSTNANTNGTPAILIYNVTSVQLFGVNALNGTLQIGLPTDNTALASSQTLGASGNLSLTGNTSFYVPRQIALTSSGNDSTVSFNVTGTAANGSVISQTLTGPNNGTVYTTTAFSSITNISSNAATPSSVSVGLQANLTGAISQPWTGWGGAIQVNALSVASTSSLSITSSSNIVNTLDKFQLGGSLQVYASGQTTGMVLTGNVSATSVDLETGQGPLVLGNLSVTSTTGDITLRGVGVTQNVSSIISSAGRVDFVGMDVNNGSSRGDVNLAGTITTVSTASNAMRVYGATNVIFGNITLGNVSSRGGIELDDGNGWNGQGWNNNQSYINGNVSQYANTSLTIGNFRMIQTSGNLTLLNANNAIQTLGYTYKAGNFSLYDSVALTINSNFDNTTSTNQSIKIQTAQNLTISGADIWANYGIILSGANITESGSTVQNNGYNNLELRANGGNVSLSGNWYSYASAFIIDNSNNVQLGYLYSSNATGLVFGSAAVASSVAANQSIGAAGNLTINGSSASNGSVSYTTGQRVGISSASDLSGVSFTVTGTNMFGQAITENVTGANAGSVATTNYFATVTSVASNAAASNVLVGSAAEVIAGNVTQSNYLDRIPLISGNVSGSITLNNNSNSFYTIGNLKAGGNISLWSNQNPVSVNGALASTSGFINFNVPYAFNLNSNGSITTGSTGNITLISGTSGGYADNFYGSVSAGSGGLTVTAGGWITTYSGSNLTSAANIRLNTTNSGYGVNVYGNITGNYGVYVNSNGTFTNNATGAILANATNGTVNITTTNPTNNINVGGNITAGSAGIIFNSCGTFVNNATGNINATSTGYVKIFSPDSLNGSVTLGGNITAGAGGIGINSGTFVNQTAGVLTTNGALYGLDIYGGSNPGATNPSSAGNVTLNQSNNVASIGPFYLNTSNSTFLFGNNSTGNLTLSGNITTAYNSITINQSGSALIIGTYSLSAGVINTGANISLTGRGITQAFGSLISSNNIGNGNSSGGTISLTGFDGTANGAITLSGNITSAFSSNTTAAVTIQGTTALALPNVTATAGILTLGGATTNLSISGAITQSTNSSINVSILTINNANSSAVLTNTGNQIAYLTNVSAACGTSNGLTYALDIYDSTSGLLLGSNITSGGGLRVITTQGGGASGGLATGNYSVLANGDIYLQGVGVTQSNASIINSKSNGSGTAGNITIDGAGGSTTLTLSGNLTLNGATTAINLINATNAVLHNLNATNGTVRLGTSAAPLSGAVSQDTNGTIAANTLAAYGGSFTLTNNNTINYLGDFRSTGALNLYDIGAAGLTFSGNSSLAAASNLTITNGALNIGDFALNASSNGAGVDLVLSAIGISQTSASKITTSTAEVFGGTGNIALFSTLNAFQGQVSLNATGSSVQIQNAAGLSLNRISGQLANTTSLTAWAGTVLTLSSENISITSGSVDFRSLNGTVSTPGNITTTSGNVTLISCGSASQAQVNSRITTGSGNITITAANQVSLVDSVSSTSGNINVLGQTITHSTGSSGTPLSLSTGSNGTIVVNATGTSGLVMGQYYSYQANTGLISITSGSTAEISNIVSNGTVNINTAGNIRQLTGAALFANVLCVSASSNSSVTLANTNNTVNYLNLGSTNASANATGTGNLSFYNNGAVAVRSISTLGNVTFVSTGNITTDAVNGTGTVTANYLNVSTVNTSGAGISLTGVNNAVTLLSAQVTTDGTNISGNATTHLGAISFTDTVNLTVQSINTNYQTILTETANVSQTGAILSPGLGLSGSGNFVLNYLSSNIPINNVSTFASNATGTVNFDSSVALAIGNVGYAGVLSQGGSLSLLAPSITTTGYTINTTAVAGSGAAGGAVTLTTTGNGSAGRLVVGNIAASGGNTSSGVGGAGGVITLTSTGDYLNISGLITSRGATGSSSNGTAGTLGLVVLNGAVSQTNGSGSNSINVGHLRTQALNASAFLDTNNTADYIAANITGTGQSFTYLSAANYTIGGGATNVTGIATQGGNVILSNSAVVISASESIATLGGNFTANNIGGFNSSAVALSTLGNITYAGGIYKGGARLAL